MKAPTQWELSESCTEAEISEGNWKKQQNIDFRGIYRKVGAFLIPFLERSMVLMGFLSSLFRSGDDPQNRTSGSAYSFFMGGSTSGKRVNECSSMQMKTVYSCVRILSEVVAGLPLHLYRYTDSGGKEKRPPIRCFYLVAFTKLGGLSTARG